MRAVFAIKSLNTIGGGAEKVFTQVISGLVARGHEVRVLTFDPPGTSFYPLDRSAARTDLNLGPVGSPTPRGALIQALPRIRKVVEAMEPDIAVGFMHSTFVPLGVALAGTGIPLIASEHTSIEHFGRSRVQRLLLELAPLLSVAGTIPSDRVRRDYPHRLRRRMWVIPNPVSSQPTAARRSRGHVVLAVGRLSAEKNHGELIRAFERVALRFRDWQLRIIGDGVLRSDLESEVQKSGLEHQVVLPGATNDVAAEYASAAFVVVPSRYESFGLVTAEALAAGRAVIGFADCPGTNGLIAHGVNGLLVDGSGDRVSSLAAGLERMMADDELRQRMGTAGPASVSAFDLDAVVDRWEDLLLRCSALRR